MGRPPFFSFQPKYLTVSNCLVHYVDGGVGLPVVMLHRVTVWSFSYRGLIGQLRLDVRCIAADMPGFGLSVAPTDFLTLRQPTMSTAR